MKACRAKLVLTLVVAMHAPVLAKSKVQPWDLQIDADVLMTTRLPEYVGLGQVCARKDVDTQLVSRIIQNYATLYSKARADVQKQIDDAARIAAMSHGTECLKSADDTRFKALYPELQAMDGYLAEAVGKAAAPTR